MPALLLAYGDPEARDMLRKAIDARYGPQPPAIEYLQMNFNGRVRARIGPLMTWVPIEAAAYFNFPRAMRWDFTVKPMGFAVQRGIETYNGESYRRVRGKKLTTYTDAEMMSQFRRRLWAVAALMLTPLSERYIKLAKVEDNVFTATNTELGDTVTIRLRSDFTLESVQVECLNPDTGRQQTFKLLLSPAFVEKNALVLPEHITSYWDDQIYFEMKPTSADSHLRIPTEIFRSDRPANV